GPNLGCKLRRCRLLRRRNLRFLLRRSPRPCPEHIDADILRAIGLAGPIRRAGAPDRRRRPGLGSRLELSTALRLEPADWASSRRPDRAAVDGAFHDALRVRRKA